MKINKSLYLTLKAGVAKQNAMNAEMQGIDAINQLFVSDGTNDLVIDSEERHLLCLERLPTYNLVAYNHNKIYISKKNFKELQTAIQNMEIKEIEGLL